MDEIFKLFVDGPRPHPLLECPLVIEVLILAVCELDGDVAQLA